MSTTDWPQPPIRPEDLPKIRELLSAEDYEELLKRLGGGFSSCAGARKSPERRWDAWMNDALWELLGRVDQQAF